MTKCPVCAHPVKTPSVFHVDAWRWLTCLHCTARLERKNPRLLLALIPVYLCLLAVSRLGRQWALVAEVLTPLTAGLMIVLFLRPQLQVRKPPPKPEITLKIDSQAQSKR